MNITDIGKIHDNSDKLVMWMNRYLDALKARDTRAMQIALKRINNCHNVTTSIIDKKL